MTNVRLGSMKIGIFLPGTAIMHSSAAAVERSERVEQVRRRDPSVGDFAAYVPTPGASEKTTAKASAVPRRRAPPS